MSDQMFSGMDAASIALSHGPEVYLNWFEIGTSDKTFQYASYHRFIIDDTADVTIWGADNTLLFQSEDGQIVTSILPGTISLDRFIIYLYGDTSFTYQITGDSVVGFHIEEYKRLQSCNRVVAFDLLELSDEPWTGTCDYDMTSSTKDYVLYQEGSANQLPEHDSGEITPDMYLRYSSFESISTSSVSGESDEESVDSENSSQDISGQNTDSQNGEEVTVPTSTEDDSISDEESNKDITTQDQNVVSDAVTQEPDDNDGDTGNNSSSQEEDKPFENGLIYTIITGVVMILAAVFLVVRRRKDKQ